MSIYIYNIMYIYNIYIYNIMYIYSHTLYICMILHRLTCVGRFRLGEAVPSLAIQNSSLNWLSLCGRGWTWTSMTASQPPH